MPGVRASEAVFGQVWEKAHGPQIHKFHNNFEVAGQLKLPA